MLLSQRIEAALNRLISAINTVDAKAAAAPGVHAQEATVRTGSYLSCALNATALTTGALAANRFDFIPYHPAINLNINELAIEVTTPSPLSLAQIGVYSSSNIQLPANLLAISANLDCSTTGAKTAAINLSLVAGTKYWLAINSSGTQTIRLIGGGALMPVEAPTFGATSIPTLRRATGQTFANGLPAVAPATAAVSASAAYIRLRVA